MAGFTRRQFLEDAALAAAMAAALPGGELFAADKKKKEKPPKKKPSELLRVAIVGAGARGNTHIGAFLENPDTEIAYIVDADEKIGQKKAEAVGKMQGKMPKYAQDLRQAFDDKSVQLVSTATPNHWHALCAIWAMQAGKDVYVEKPSNHNLSEGRRMVETARAHHRICQVGTQCRSMQGTIDAIEYIKAGKIGTVKLARGLCYKRRKSIGPKGEYQVPAEVDYNLWCGPSHTLPLTRPKFHYDWHWQREWGNGDMGNQGPHQMDIARWGLGVNRLADSVIAYGGRLGYEDAGDVANTEVGIFEFGDKSLVFEVRGLATDPLRGAGVGVIFYGSEGYVVLTSYEGGAAFDPSGKLVTSFKGNGDHFANFIAAVRARDSKLLHADILEGHLSCAHSHLANISYYLGKPASVDEIRQTVSALKTNEDVKDCLDRTLAHLKANDVDLSKTPMSLGPMLKIDSKAETVLDNPAASALLTREYRAPFVVPKPNEV
jgi:predicted dehydrogenase